MVKHKAHFSPKVLNLDIQDSLLSHLKNGRMKIVHGLYFTAYLRQNNKTLGKRYTHCRH